MLWSIDSCQNKVSADQYHVTISLVQNLGLFGIVPVFIGIKHQMHELFEMALFIPIARSRNCWNDNNNNNKNNNDNNNDYDNDNDYGYDYDNDNDNDDDNDNDNDDNNNNNIKLNVTVL